MLPGLSEGVTAALTTLDAAALVDIGWEIDLPGGAMAATLLTNVGNENGGGSSASFAAYSAAPVVGSVAPEPGGVVLALLAALFGAFSRSASRRG
jgi:hypothetical protein